MMSTTYECADEDVDNFLDYYFCDQKNDSTVSKSSFPMPELCGSCGTNSTSSSGDEDCKSPLQDNLIGEMEHGSSYLLAGEPTQGILSVEVVPKRINGSSPLKKRRRVTTAKRPKRTKEERKQRRREKQRIIARNFRKRKKAHLLNLQEEVKRLRLENGELRKELGIEKNNEATHPTAPFASKDQIENLSQMVSDGQDAEIRRFVASSKPSKEHAEKKAKSVSFHFDQLQAHLVHNDFSKMIVLALEGEKGSETWNIVRDALSLTPKQETKLFEMRAAVASKVAEISAFRKVFAAAREKFDTSIKSLDSIVGDVTDMLNPTQEAKHILWREQNKACLKMMNCMWNMRK
eukprot:g1762.t1